MNVSCNVCIMVIIKKIMYTNGCLENGGFGQNQNVGFIISSDNAPEFALKFCISTSSDAKFAQFGKKITIIVGQCSNCLSYLR